MPDSDETYSLQKIDGGLYHLGDPYVDYVAGRSVVTLDGEFSVEQLKEIIEHMRKQEYAKEKVCPSCGEKMVLGVWTNDRRMRWCCDQHELPILLLPGEVLDYDLAIHEAF